MDTINWLVLLFEAALLAPPAIGLRQVAREHRS